MRKSLTEAICKWIECGKDVSFFLNDVTQSAQDMLFLHNIISRINVFLKFDCFQIYDVAYF